MRFGYQRVSTIDQNTERQLDGVAVDRMYTDKASGKDANRPELVRLLDNVREGGTPSLFTRWIAWREILRICAGWFVSLRPRALPWSFTRKI